MKRSLKELRRMVGLTQVEVGRNANMSQGDLSRFERRGDHLVSHLARYARALGMELEVSFIKDGKRLPVRLGGK